jgi:hydrogenase nickel incorporation protein HypB
MCQDCGCGDRELVPVDVQEKLLAGNDRMAAHNREHFQQAGVFAVNLMGSPGSGKTRLLEATASLLRGARLAALSGDLETDRDGERLRRAGISARTITTGSACHLDARLVHHALDELPIDGADFLFIENVGNLVCPAIYDLGQDANVVAMSVTEGADKPLKYPVMFRAAELVVVTKIDLLPLLDDVRLEDIAHSLARVSPSPNLIAVSARTGEGMNHWLGWLETHRALAHSCAAGSGVGAGAPSPELR